MSSKEQYKDALKRANRTIVDLKVETKMLKDALKKANGAIGALKDAILTKKPKWWQFWKRVKRTSDGMSF